MKPRHAAALALVGWYLMVPLVHTEGDKVFVESRAPVRHWGRIGRIFNSVTDCENAREKTQKNLQDTEKGLLEYAAENDANVSEQVLKRYEAGRQMRCVSKDDPDFKGRAATIDPTWSRYIPAN